MSDNGANRIDAEFMVICAQCGKTVEEEVFMDDPAWRSVGLLRHNDAGDRTEEVTGLVIGLDYAYCELVETEGSVDLCSDRCLLDWVAEKLAAPVAQEGAK